VLAALCGPGISDRTCSFCRPWVIKNAVARFAREIRKNDGVGFESYLPWKMAWLMSGQNSRNTTVIPSRETFSIHR
jgi:hypothetical protein